MSQQVRLLITIDASRPGGAASVVDALRALGVAVTNVLDELGTITATCPPEKAAEVARVPGILHVETERSVSIPSPGSKLQ